MKITTKYDIGQTVYLVTDDEQSARIITRITVGHNSVIYELSHITSTSEHYDFEFTDQEWAEIDTAGNLTTHIDKVSQQMLDQINTMRNQYQQSNYPELFGSLP
jgi:hypothetical protein